MDVVRFTVRGRKGIELKCYKIVPEGEIKGVVQLIHGMGEHKERYLHFAKYLAKNSYAVYIHDHPKHGESVKDISQVGIFTKDDKWDDMIDDCNFVNRRIKKELPDVPITILGHSMGSVIVRKLLSKHNTCATMAIIMGTIPPITLGRAIIPLTLSTVMSWFNPKNNRSAFFGKTLNEPLIKEFEPRKTDFDWLCTDEKVVEKYVKDPLCGYNYSTRFYKELFKGFLNVNKSDVIFKTAEIPLLFISGEYDSVGEHGLGARSTRELYSGHGLLDLTLETVKDARHEILNETSKKQTYDFIINWMETSLEKVYSEME